jgi:phosphoglycolate phosphatase-like HAD superfamily hydrolase
VNYLTTLVELEGVVLDVKARYWRAHCEAIEAVGFTGPEESEFWRLWRTGATDSQMVRHGKDRHVREYRRLRDARIDATDLMALDEAHPGAAVNLKILKGYGTAHLVTLCRNRDGINATLDRLDLWMHFDRKEVLPESRDRRVELLGELAGSTRPALALAGTVPFALAANEAGCRVVGMKTGLAYPKLMRQVGVDVFYGSFDDLTDALASRDPQLQKIGIL